MSLGRPCKTHRNDEKMTRIVTVQDMIDELMLVVNKDAEINIGMKKKKLYISLPISGFSLNAVALEAESYKLMWEKEGFEVVTPFDLSPDSEKPYSYHMGKDIEGLLECDAVYFAPGWVDSKGCNLEYAAAKIYRKTIYT